MVVSYDDISYVIELECLNKNFPFNSYTNTYIK